MTGATRSSPSDAGSNHADGQWWEEYRTYLRLLLDAQVDPRLRSKADLSGIVQQTLWEAHRVDSLRAMDSTARVAWLRRTLTNNLADEIRKYRSDKRDVCRELPMQATVDQSFDRLAGLISPGSSPSAGVQRAETELRLAAAMDRLPEAQREALILQHWHGWPLAEIAAHLGRTRAAVAGLLKRGLRQLRVELNATD